MGFKMGIENAIPNSARYAGGWVGAFNFWIDDGLNFLADDTGDYFIFNP